MAAGERVVLHSLAPGGGGWRKQSAVATIEPAPFAQGSFRVAHRGALAVGEGSAQQMVFKFARDARVPRGACFAEAEAQAQAGQWARRFNAELPGSRLCFVECFVVELAERPGRPLCGCEPFIEGEFVKHNNNVGAVGGGDNSEASREERELAQAFSHFTFEKSGRALLICDIQGVGSRFTDPQVHRAAPSAEARVSAAGGWSGSLGETGIRAFLLRHKCNRFCQALALPEMAPHELKRSSIVASAPASGLSPPAPPPPPPPPPRRGSSAVPPRLPTPAVPAAAPVAAAAAAPLDESDEALMAEILSAAE